MLARAPLAPSPPTAARNCWMSFLRPTASWTLWPRMTWWIESTRWMSCGLSISTTVEPSCSRLSGSQRLRFRNSSLRSLRSSGDGMTRSLNSMKGTR